MTCCCRRLNAGYEQCGFIFRRRGVTFIYMDDLDYQSIFNQIRNQINGRQYVIELESYVF